MKKKITIGLFIDNFFPMVDGVVSVVDNYARRLCKIANVYVFAPSINGEEFDDNTLPYKVVRSKSIKMPFIDYSLPKIDKNYKKELDKYNLDIVHIHSPFTMGKLGIDYAKKHNIPVIGTMHSQFKKDIKRAVHNDFLASKINKILINTFNKCDECWAVNKEVARIFYEDYGYKKLPRVMNNATEMEPVKDYDKAIRDINKIHGLKREDKVFLFVGRINKLKNVFFIVDVLEILKKKKRDYNFKMIFVGTGQDEVELKEYIKNKELEEYIIFTGKILDRELIKKYFARADLFLFPSLYDASSIVQIEAASQHTPTVFIEGSATSATITDGVDGIIAKNDINEYARVVDELMHDEKKLNKLKDNAFKDLYVSWDDQIKEIYKLYLEFINRTK